MRSLDGLHLSPSVSDARSWSLSSSGLFTVKYLFLALSQFSGSPPVFPTKFVWNSQVPFKVKSFVWLVAHKKTRAHEWLFSSEEGQWMVVESSKAARLIMVLLDTSHTNASMDDIQKDLSPLVKRLAPANNNTGAQIPSICDMMAISFKGLGSSVRGKTLWQIVCLTLPLITWQERNVRIFEGKMEGGRDIV
ncbi:hypothetical protein CK203_042442 [Vitis vinifera]|uniref:Reverse transcriptase zinc-binding domain-containing protein n=1 Tax=Vitis vinifera TaxID=29760 RepID=A0A438HEX4_VITVI|nr:hypothetical protein CK203_042442 [Vitis vinifera]